MADKKYPTNPTLKKDMPKKYLNFLEVFEKNACNVSHTCKAVHIDRSTYYEWMKDPLFNDAVTALKEGLIDFAEGMLHQKIKDKDTTSIIFFLKTIGKKRGYIEKQEVALSTDTPPVINIITDYEAYKQLEEKAD